MGEVFVHVTRGSLVESRHQASIALVNTSGQLVAAAGNPDRITFWRSAAKPLQLLPLVADGGIEHFGLTEAEVAVMASSHSGEEGHIRAVQSILTKLELGEEALRCGAHMPISQQSTAALLRDGELPRPIHSNCSGKHAAMLALTVLHHWPLQGYMEPDHPVQSAIRATIATLSGVPEAVIPMAMDGCGVPTYALTLHAMALAYARLAVPTALPPPLHQAAQRITLAMRRHPHMTAGAGRFSTSVMAATGERLIVKSGAEAVLNMGVPELGLGIAIKIEDGAPRAIAPLAVELLCRLGVLNEEEAGSLADLHRPVVRNFAGHPVGVIEADIPEDLALALGTLRQNPRIC